MNNCICRICIRLIEAGLGTMTRGCPFCYRMYLINLIDGPIAMANSHRDIKGSKKRYYSLELEN